MSIKIKIISAAVMISVCASFCQALTNYYVVPPPNDGITPPYTNWAWAATNIQDVVNIALGGDTIYVTNGHYYLASAISVGKGVIIRSFHNGITDPTNTIIDGNNYVGRATTNICISISSTATVDGLTFTNGEGRGNGGGMLLSGAGCLITNCIITGNTTTNFFNTQGGGMHVTAQATIANCRIIGNSANSWGGGIKLDSIGTIVKDCFIGWNLTYGNGSALGMGGTTNLVFNCDIVSNKNCAIYFTAVNTVISNCTIRGNTNGSAFDFYTASSAYTNNLITHCSIIDNYSASGVGGTMLYGVRLRNCLIARNRGTGSGGGLYFKSGATGYVESCTIVSNYAATGGGIYNDAASFFTVSDTIVCSNTAGSSQDLNVTGNQTNYFYNSLCKTVSLPPAQGNITNDPVFVDFNSGNYRLVRGSPCINTGTNQDWMTGALDLDRRRRLDKFCGRVDMGCYEYVFSGTMFIVRGR